MGIEKDSPPVALLMSDQASQSIHSNLVDQRLDLGTNDVPNLFLGT
jgi:hypothetical protein